MRLRHRTYAIAVAQLSIATVNAANRRAVNAATGVIGPDGKWIVRCNRRGRQFAVARARI